MGTATEGKVLFTHKPCYLGSRDNDNRQLILLLYLTYQAVGEPEPAFGKEVQIASMSLTRRIGLFKDRMTQCQVALVNQKAAELILNNNSFDRLYLNISAILIAFVV